MTTAFQGGKTEIFKLLKCLINARLSQTTLDKALCKAAERGQMQCIEILITAGAKDLNGALYSAFLAKNVVIQNALILKGAKRYTVLHTAVSKDSLEDLNDQIISNHINATDKEGRTALHIAARKGYTKSLEMLLKTNKVNINIADKYGWTPLHFAVRYANAETVKALLDADGINVNAKDLNGYTPLHVAAEYAGADVIKLLLGADGIKVNEKTNEFFLHIPSRIAQYLQFTALHLAAKKGRTAIVRELLKAKDINIEVKAHSGFTAFELAFGDQCKELLKAVSKKK